MTIAGLKLLVGKFDIHVDSNHRWETDRVLELDAYPMYEFPDSENGTSTDMTVPIASVRIPAGDYREDIWIASTESKEVEDLPLTVKMAYYYVISLAIEVQKDILMDGAQQKFAGKFVIKDNEITAPSVNERHGIDF